MAQRGLRNSRSPSSQGSSSSRSGSGSGDEEEPPVTVTRAELVRGHRPVVVSEVPLYVALRDKDGRLFEDKGNCSNVRYRWMRGPVIKSCFFHPHKMSQIRDVAKTYQCYCSKECFLRGWHTLPQQHWGTKPEEDTFEEPIAEWTEVANTRAYCPTKEDIDRPLRLDIIPVLKDGRDSTIGAMSLTTGTVKETPQEARTRRMISNGGTFNAEWLSKQFKVMNWNVLADLYATESMYPYCEKWALSWSWRKHLILKELKSMAADIITLQEVQKDAYDDWFRPQLAEAGYEGLFQSKKRDPIFHRGKYTIEGCATFYKTTRFKRVDKHVIDYDKLSANEVRCLIPEPAQAEKCMQRLLKGNIALAVMLEDLHIKTTHGTQATGPSVRASELLPFGDILCASRGMSQHLSCLVTLAAMVTAPCYAAPEALRGSSVEAVRQEGAGSSASIPRSCLKWFDGCNTCTASQGELGVCTLKSCSVRLEAGCLELAPSTVPPGCTQWFDGCNTCAVVGGEASGCTKKACPWLEEPRCLRSSAPAVPPACSSWFDGCNTCQVSKEGQLGSCTRRICESQGQAGCVHFVEQSVPPGCTSWFDGCNTCNVVGGQVGGCTRRACQLLSLPGCRNFAQPQIPATCSQWFDGCNLCTVSNGTLGACTLKACELLEVPRCTRQT